MIIRPLALAVVLIIAAGSLVPVHADDYERVARQRYSGGGGNDYMFTADCNEVLYFSGDDDTIFLEFKTRRGERFMEIEIADETPGMTIVAFVAQGVRAGDRHVICGRTDEPISILGGRPVLISLMRGASPRGPSLFSDGVVTATFAR